VKQRRLRELGNVDGVVNGHWVAFIDREERRNKAVPISYVIGDYRVIVRSPYSRSIQVTDPSTGIHIQPGVTAVRTDQVSARTRPWHPVPLIDNGIRRLH
jgi:hypothetical protein